VILMLPLLDISVLLMHPRACMFTPMFIVVLVVDVLILLLLAMPVVLTL
jgi:hypothetical protein